MTRIWNFSAGPAALPEEVLQQAQAEMLDWHGAGCSVMEMSHRGKEFMSILDQAEADLRELMGIPEQYKVLFLQGGATQQFAQIPMNLLAGRSADYIVTGSWSKKAFKEAQRIGNVRCAATTESSGFTRLPMAEEIKLDPFAAYLHVCTNETIHGVEIPAERIADTGVPLVADMSSHILSRPVQCREIRPDLRRRPEEHRPLRADPGRCPSRPARHGAADHPDGHGLCGDGRERLDAEHSADLRHLHRRPGFPVAEAAGRSGRNCYGQCRKSANFVFGHR
jgi:hypothetical protein